MTFEIRRDRPMLKEGRYDVQPRFERVVLALKDANEWKDADVYVVCADDGFPYQELEQQLARLRGNIGFQTVPAS